MDICWTKDEMVLFHGFPSEKNPGDWDLVPSSASSASPFFTHTHWHIGHCIFDLRYIFSRWYISTYLVVRIVYTYIVYIYTLYTYMHACMHACIHTYIHTITYDYIRLHTITYDYIHTYDYIRLHTITYDYIRLHTITYIHTYIHTYIYIYIFIGIMQWFLVDLKYEYPKFPSNLSHAEALTNFLLGGWTKRCHCEAMHHCRMIMLCRQYCI